MKRLSCVFFVAGLAGVSGGCNRSPQSDRPTAGTGAVERVHRDAKAVEARTKKNVDDFAAEADAAVRKASNHIKKDAGQHTDDLSALAASIAEDAKDRALDIPEAVDQALERHTRRWQENRRRREEQSSVRD